VRTRARYQAIAQQANGGRVRPKLPSTATSPLAGPLFAMAGRFKNKDSALKKIKNA